jgi:diadenosine tetraphosphate (Ap4A) HIT family hydrolase
MTADRECLSCKGLLGAPRISPGPPIHIGRYWQVEHAYPSQLVGWLVIALRRHAVALHELTADEFAEFGPLLERTVRVLHAATGSAKEYIACYAEAPGFEHIHFHVVPRAADLSSQFHGAGSFELLRNHPPASAGSVEVFCEELRDAFHAPDRPDDASTP